MARMRKTLALMPTLMPAMRPSEMDARIASPPPDPLLDFRYANGQTRASCLSAWLPISARMALNRADVPEVLWRPNPATARASAIAQFASIVRERRLAGIDELDYQLLRLVGRRIEFWAAAAVSRRTIPRLARSDARFAGHAGLGGSPAGRSTTPSTHSATGPGGPAEDLAVVFVREDGLQRLVSHGELRALVGSLRWHLQRLGVGRGDRVVALMPNCVETLAAFAVASLGTVGSSYSPDFGAHAVRDRFAQLGPSVFLTVDGWWRKALDIRDRVQALVEQLS